MAFKFSLEPALDARRRLEEAAQRELAQAMQAVARIDAGVAAMRQRLDLSANERERMCAKGYDPRRMDLFARFDQDLARQIVVAQTERARADERVRERRARLLDAVRARRVMDELKKTEFEEYRKKEDAEERKFNDEVAIFAFHRRRAENIAAPQEA
jgi:flagellar export protein FliJ